MNEDTKKIEELIKKLGYKKAGKDVTGQNMYSKGNVFIYFSTIKFPVKKTETFKEASDRIFDR